MSSEGSDSRHTQSIPVLPRVIENVEKLLGSDPGPGPDAYRDLRTAKPDWGDKALGREMRSIEDFETSFENTISIVEPWEDVGTNRDGEGVRASVNVGCFAHAVGMQPRVVPLWDLRCGYPTLPAEELARALLKYPVVFEGGGPNVFDETTFHQDKCPRSFLWQLYKRVLLQRHKSSVQIFICLSHQLVASTLVELVKDASLALQGLPDEDAVEVGKKIKDVGKKIEIVKNKVVVAKGYEHQAFATANMEIVEKEVGEVELYRFKGDIALKQVRPGNGNDEFEMCLKIHNAYGKQHSGVVKDMIKSYQDGDRVKVAMFHSVEVNCEAMVFVHFALDEICKIRDKIPQDSWMRDLPVGLNITACTHRDGTGDRSVAVAGSLQARLQKMKENGSQMATNVACMRLDYRTRENVELKSYTCQFHPELRSTRNDAGIPSLRDARKQPMPEFVSLAKDNKINDGMRMLGSFFKE